MEVCRGIVEMQMANIEMRDEMSENHYKDNVMLVLLEQEVADLQMSGRDGREQNREVQSGFDGARDECSSLQNQLAELRSQIAEKAEHEEAMQAESARRADESQNRHAEVLAGLEHQRQTDL